MILSSTSLMHSPHHLVERFSRCTVLFHVFFHQTLRNQLKRHTNQHFYLNINYVSLPHSSHRSSTVILKSAGSQHLNPSDKFTLAKLLVPCTELQNKLNLADKKRYMTERNKLSHSLTTEFKARTTTVCKWTG